MKEPFQPITPEVLTIDQWQQLNSLLVAGFTTKIGGFSERPFTGLNLGLHVHDKIDHVHQNRRRIGEILDFPLSTWVCADQVHDAKIVKVESKDIGKGVYDYENSIESTDGFYTLERGCLLTSCYADCVPLFFFAPKHNVIGLAHAGWKGTVKKIAENMIKTLQKNEHIDSTDILVAIGPSIQNCCYTVDDIVIQAVRNMGLGGEHYYYQTSPGQYQLNLARLNKDVLLKSGVIEENILTTSYCTSCAEQLFFSHRRDKGTTGRMMSFIGIREA
ncbi:peptidoglycan editing factor PgeF [Bacillus salitolerans]|uniref:Purine nucleoside phosphorylase n=1 Tax=Bacillus salitolerans TaxID=1437434 RepID=A0ABW4LKK4_9BACI